MKFCEHCGVEIATVDGDNQCTACEEINFYHSDSKKVDAKRIKRNAVRRDRESALRSCGLVKVRGAMGGTYWE